VVFAIEDMPDHELFGKPFAIITACNPNNKTMDAATNVARQQALEHELKRRGLRFESALGYLEQHYEESFCVYDISLQEALDLGRKFCQYSVFYHGDKCVGYYEVATSLPILNHDTNR